MNLVDDIMKAPEPTRTIAQRIIAHDNGSVPNEIIAILSRHYGNRGIEMLSTLGVVVHSVIRAECAKLGVDDAQPFAVAFDMILRASLEALFKPEVKH